MTEKRQNIEQMFEGTKKTIRVVVYDSANQVKDITGCDFVYAIFDDNDNYYLIKNSVKSNEISILDPAAGLIGIYLASIDTINLDGVYRHQCQLIDTALDSDVIFSGTIRIFKNFTLLKFTSYLPVYLIGG